MFKRGEIYWVSINGVRCSTGERDRKRAKEEETRLRVEARDRSRGLYVKTWDEACLEWLQSNTHLQSYSKNAIQAKWWTRHLRGLKVTVITRELVHSIIVKERPVTSERSKQNNTANGYVAFVRKVLRHVDVNVRQFVVYPATRRGKRWLRRDEWESLLPHMDDDLRHVCTFALATGLREANVIGFQWSWIHGNAAYLPREVTKTDQDYGIPLSSVSQAVLAERRGATVRHKDLVFTDNGKPWYKVKLLRRLYKAVQAAELEPIVFHTFRHTFASWLAQKGVSDSVRRRLGCWVAEGGAAGTYVHFDVESLRQFAEMAFSTDSLKEDVAENLRKLSELQRQPWDCYERLTIAAQPPSTVVEKTA